MGIGSVFPTVLRQKFCNSIDDTCTEKCVGCPATSAAYFLLLTFIICGAMEVHLSLYTTTVGSGNARHLGRFMVGAVTLSFLVHVRLGRWRARTDRSQNSTRRKHTAVQSSIG